MIFDTVCLALLNLRGGIKRLIGNGVPAGVAALINEALRIEFSLWTRLNAGTRNVGW